MFLVHILSTFYLDNSSRGPTLSFTMGKQDHDFEVFFDGDCPLCRREIRLLKNLDKRGRIKATDLSDPTFSPATIGVSHASLMAEIHGRTPDGTLVRGVEVFRQLYGAVGFGWAVKVSRWPGISFLLDRAYALFAKNRLRLTGRCDRSTCELPQQSESRP